MVGYAATVADAVSYVTSVSSDAIVDAANYPASIKRVIFIV